MTKEESEKETLKEENKNNYATMRLIEKERDYIIKISKVKDTNYKTNCI